jgi:uncharacterized phage-like protein YoqJ
VELTGPVRVVSDSTYVVNCFKNRWWEGWQRRNWKNSQRQDVANQDLWRPLVDRYLADPGRLEFQWVKGHSGNDMNDLVDRLAVEAAARQEGRSGTGRPVALGPADRPAGSRAVRAASADRAGASGSALDDREMQAVADGPVGSGAGAPRPGGAGVTLGLPAGHRILVTGLRPEALGGWDDNLVAAAVRRRLAEILAAKVQLHPDLVVTTGLGLGAEQLAAEAAVEAGVPYAAVLAFDEQDRMWPTTSRARFASLVEGAAATLVLDDHRPADRQAAGRALGQRDQWIIGQADEAVVVWDDEDPIVGRTVRALQKALGEDQVWVVTP